MRGEGSLQSIPLNSHEKSNYNYTYDMVSQLNNFIPGKEFDKLLYLSVIGESKTTTRH